MQLFDKQRSRGTEGFGLFDGQELNMVHASKEDKILKWLVKYDSNLIMFHHRNPTSTVNVKRAAHPFSTKKYFGDNQYILVHNGMIYNSKELKPEHEKLGIKYYSELEDKTFNDSEALLWDLALVLEGKKKELEAYGMIAFICMKLHKGKLERMYFARNGNPLNMLRDKGGIALSSENGGDPIDPHVLHMWNYKAKRLTKKPMVIPSSKWSSSTDSRSVKTIPATSTGYRPYEWGRGRDEWDDGGVKPQWNSAEQFELFDNEFDEITSSTPGSWLGEELRNKFSHIIPKFNRKTVQYEKDPDTQTYVPVKTESQENLDELEGWLDELAIEQEEERWTRWADEYAFDEVSKSEVENKALAYLSKHKGLMAAAYAEIEDEYQQIWEDIDTYAEYRETRVLEALMEWFDTDPDFEDENSVSTLWKEVFKWDEDEVLDLTKA